MNLQREQSVAKEKVPDVTVGIAKLYDCQQMPEEIKQEFFLMTEDYSPNVYVGWDVLPASTGDRDIDTATHRVNRWLRQHGANEGEAVLIKHWWP